jgi:hypothetical protein
LIELRRRNDIDWDKSATVLVSYRHFALARMLKALDERGMTRMRIVS